MMMRFDQLIKNDRYQVFLFTCPAVMPFFFAVHPWLVVNMKGSVSRFGIGRNIGTQRWEVFWRPEAGKENWGHLHRNSLPPTQGIPAFSFSGRFFWKGHLRAVVEGGEGSVAQRMAEFIEKSAQEYPYQNTYSFTGPNSNTYVQWVLNHFPESGLKLPWNAFGKNFK